MLDQLLNTNLDNVLSMSDKEFFSNFSFIMHIALIKDMLLYTFLIDKMYEICERDEETIKEILERVENNKKLIIELNNKDNKLNPLSFGFRLAQSISDTIDEDLSAGEYLSLGCVAEAFISYKKNWLNKDEYYEIRDMYVPFYLPISITKIDIDGIINNFINNNTTVLNSDTYEFVLLKKIGKTVIDKTINIDDIREALNEINFDEAW